MTVWCCGAGEQRHGGMGGDFEATVYDDMILASRNMAISGGEGGYEAGAGRVWEAV